MSAVLEENGIVVRDNIDNAYIITVLGSSKEEAVVGWVHAFISIWGEGKFHTIPMPQLVQLEFVRPGKDAEWNLIIDNGYLHNAFAGASGEDINQNSRLSPDVHIGIRNLFQNKMEWIELLELRAIVLTQPKAKR